MVKETREHPTYLAFAMVLAKEGQLEELVRKMDKIPHDGNYNKAFNALCLEFGGKILPLKKERHCSCGTMPFNPRLPNIPIYKGAIV